MQTTRLALSKYICGMGASLIIFLAGGWLILAPFALGYQRYGADWVSQTTNDFWVGLPTVVVAFISFILFFMSLLGSLRASGVLIVQPRVQVTTMQQPAGYMPQAPPAPQSDLDRTLATLAAALAADLNTRRQAGGEQQGDLRNEQIVNRREG